MATAKPALRCSDCEDQIYQCDGCGEYFTEGCELICQESETIQKHYCETCGNK